MRMPNPYEAQGRFYKRPTFLAGTCCTTCGIAPVIPSPGRDGDCLPLRRCLDHFLDLGPIAPSGRVLREIRAVGVAVRDLRRLLAAVTLTIRSAVAAVWRSSWAERFILTGLLLDHGLAVPGSLSISVPSTLPVLRFTW
jgi:hypothetical protein